MARRVIVFSAHPDDLEIGCAGTCRKLQQQGYEIVSVVTVKPSAEINQNRSEQIVRKELAKSYNISKFRLKVFNTELFDNGRPNLLVNNNTMSNLSRLFEECEIAILPNPEDSHQDHRNTFELAYPLVKKVKQVWTMHSWPYNLYYKNNSANLFVDISQQWNFKLKLLKCYSSYLNKEKIQEIKTINEYYGLRSGVRLAESFTLVHKYD